VSSAVATAGSLRLPDILVKWLRSYFGWFLSICIVTSLLCGAMEWDWHSDSHVHFGESNTLEPYPSVSIAVSPGVVGISSQVLDGTVQVTSHSSVLVDAVVQAEDGCVLCTYRGLMPGEPFSFEYDGEPCTIVASVS
jgi:hypothetical protein